MKTGIRNILIKGLVIGSLLCIFNSNLSAQGLTVTGTIDVTNLSVTSTINAASLTTSGSVGILGNLYVAGSVTLPNLNITSLANLTQITVSNNVTTANLSVTSTATVASLTNTGNEGIVGNLVVAGNTTVSTLTNTGNEGIVGNLVVAGSTTLNGNVTMSPSSAAGTINIGSAAGTGGITIGTSSNIQAVNIASGTGAYFLGLGSNTLGPANLYVGNATANTGGVNVVVGSITNQANTTTIQGGNGTAAIALTPQTTGTIVIGAAAGTGAITLGSSSTTQTVNIGTGAGVATINIGTGNTASVLTVGGATGLNTLTVTGVATLTNPKLIGTGTPSSSTFWRGDGTWATASSSGWGTTGNTGTTVPTSAIGSTINNNFIGTIDKKDFAFATNNLERMRISSGGLVTIGISSTTVAGSSSNPQPYLEMPGNTAASSLKIGTLEFQSYSLNNSFFGDNMIYGSGGFVRRAAGYGLLFYFGSNEGQFRLASSSTAGSLVTENSGSGLVPLKMNITGSGTGAVSTIAMGGGNITNNGDSTQGTLVVYSNVTTTAVPIITGKFTLHANGGGTLGATGNAGVFYTAPTIAGGTNVTVAIAGTNTDGRITITPGATSTANATVATITYSAVFAGTAFQYPNGSVITLTPANAAAAALSGNLQVYASGNTTSFTITGGSTTLVNGTAYIWNYHVGGY
jgi:hypothetical protein